MLGFIIASFVFGLLIGSFLNVVIYRLGSDESFWTGRSHCRDCGQTLKTKDLIPVISWLWRRGRCCYCDSKISWQYPLVELSTALLFALAVWQFGLTPQLIAVLFFIVFLTIIFVYDLRHYLILDVVTLPAMGVALVANLYFGTDFFNLLLAGIIGGGFFLLQFLISRGRWIGGGDIRLGLLLGLIVGWPLIVVTLALAYVFGAVVGLILLMTGQKKLSSRLPFGVFLAPAALVVIFWGPQILNWYLGLLWR